MARVVHVLHGEDNFKKMLIASLGLHLAVLLFFTLKMAFFPSDVPKYVPTIRVDLVGLPDKRKDDTPVIAPKPEEKTAPVPEPKKEKTEKKIEEKKLSHEQSSALNKLKTLSAIEKLKNMKDSSKEEAHEAPKKEIIKGNVLSPGTALTGLNKIDFNQYIGSLDAQVKSHWALPEWMARLNLRAEIVIKIDKNGQITEKTFILKSGNADFDSRVLSAIEQSNPFPPPPEKFIDLVGIKGITFAFPE